MQPHSKVKFWLVMMILSIPVQNHAQENALPIDMSFLEYLGTMVEEDGQLLDVTEVFAQDIAYPETSVQIDENPDTSAELPVQPSEARQ
jgi:hypothetical protein